MELGAFSLSLNVADLAASRAFYEKLGFVAIAGEPEQGWQILRNGGRTLGLFQGHIPANTLTFNPGWTDSAEAMDSFEDVRSLQAKLEEQGVDIISRASNGTGPASFVIADPDNNHILIDQHVYAPGS